MTAVRYTPDERVQIALRWREELRPLVCPRHATPLEVIEVWASRDVPGGVIEHSFPTPGGGAILAGWNVTRVQVECAACGEGVQGIDVGDVVLPASIGRHRVDFQGISGCPNHHYVDAQPQRLHTAGNGSWGTILPL